MASATEAAAAKQGIAANLAVGVETLSGNDTVTFTRYNRLVLPLDGYVFWVKADLLTTSALLGLMGLNTTRFNAPQMVETPAPTLSVPGSLHYATNQRQDEDETVGLSVVTFTALEPVQEFNAVQPDTLWVGEYAGDAEGFDAPVTFAFSSRGGYYKEADLFHYVGTAVLPAFRTQLVDSVAALAQRQLIVSNSLPIWLSLVGYSPPYAGGFNNALPLYPSFLVPDNLAPPYGVVHIEPSRTESLQSASAFGPTLSQAQLAVDRVRVTLYGLTNDAALSFLSMVEQYCYDYAVMGLMNMPTVRDDKRTQVELGVLAMKKMIDFDVSYNQATARDVARQYIEKCVVGYSPALPPAP
jgi:hypothetical protein